ncbi:MAG: methylmalonyl Co-A mutase-associated GTPase MeaB [Nitrospirota bacterium]
MSGSNPWAPRKFPTIPLLIEEVGVGNTRAISRAITLVESDGPEKKTIMEALGPISNHANIIGVTGYPGAGKSTVIDQLITTYRSQEKTVAVLAVDISSSLTGGAILGDRIRMQNHSLDKQVFIRSMGTRGHQGGLARATKDAIHLLDAARFDVILIETIGMGQEEGEIAQLAQTVVLVVTPDLGDDVQAMKAGILEVAHIVVINKADHHGALQTLQSLREWVPEVVLVTATTGEGIQSLGEAITAHQKSLEVEAPVSG